jgi:hypothetical protein
MLLPLLALFTLAPGPKLKKQDAPAVTAMRQESPTGITHGVLALGADTFVLSGDGKTLFIYPRNTRDGWMLPNGNLLLAVTKCDAYPGGAAVEVDHNGKILFEYRGTQSEVNTVQPLLHDHFLLTEAGPKPRILEMDRSGKIIADVPIQCQTEDLHMQTRMTRKLPNGNYLVPQLLDKVVREYTPQGKIVWEARTPNWPFTAIRLANGHTLITCTRGDLVIEVDKEAKTVWQVSNADLPGTPIHDACGAQRLPNGDTVITSYGANGASDIKLLEVTPQKKIVWTLYTGQPHGIHEFQILDAQGKALRERPLR